MMVIPITREHKLFGIDLSREDGEVATITSLADGTTVINTTDVGKKILGYGGQTPLEIYVADGKITKIRFLENNETPEFFGAVRNSDLTDSYIGLSLEEAAKVKPDAISGATFSSTAVIGNIHVGVEAALAAEGTALEKGSTLHADIDAKFICTLIVILAGAVIPLLLSRRGKRNAASAGIYRKIQLVLNVVVLGFWGGTFICYTLMVSYLGNGIGIFIIALPLLLMLVTAFIYPMFGKPNHYCNWICPYGSLQEMAGWVIPWKIKMSRKTVKVLTILRDTLWFVLMWLLWTGLWFDWMDYEAFAAFFIRDAGAVVLGIAGGFLLLSFIVPRPYCRFLCPTGTLFKMASYKPMGKGVKST